MNRRIPAAEAEFHPLARDASGRLFSWRERLLRAIPPAAAGAVRELFESGLPDALAERGLLAPSRITDFELEGAALVVEHQRIAPLVYPYEWGFSMLRDAALAVLEVNRIARGYGYQTQDCHGYNICFDGAAPVFVDLGSFVRADPQDGRWAAYEEFLTFYWYPLVLWSRGARFFARRALLGCALNDALSHRDYALYRLPWLRFLGLQRLDRLARLWANARAASLRRLPEFLRASGPGRLAQLQRVDFDALAAKVARLAAPPRGPGWGGYQAAYFDATGGPRPSMRFARVLEILGGLGVRSVTELAGNEGSFALRAAALPGIESVACTDRDDDAVDALYGNVRRARVRVTPAVLDFMFPLTNFAGNRPAQERLRADAVVALAVTHHLILGEGLPVERVIEALAGYTRDYVLVEFMPLGLHVPGRAVDVPPWYTTEWFGRAFGARFAQLAVEKLEENRILFVGRRRAEDGSAP